MPQQTSCSEQDRRYPITRSDKIRASKAWGKALVPVLFVTTVQSKIKRAVVAEIVQLSPLYGETLASPQSVSLSILQLRQRLEKCKRLDRLWRWTLFMVLVRLRVPKLKRARDRAGVIVKHFLHKVQEVKYVVFIPVLFRTLMMLKRFISKYIFRRRLFLLISDKQWLRLEVDLIKKEAIVQYERMLWAHEKRRPAEIFQHDRKMQKYRVTLFPTDSKANAALTQKYEEKCTDRNLRLSILKVVCLEYRIKLLENGDKYRRKLKKYEMKKTDWVFLQDIFKLNCLAEPQPPKPRILSRKVPDSIVSRAIETARLIHHGDDADQAIGELHLTLKALPIEQWQQSC